MRNLPVAFLLLLSACTTYPTVSTDFDPSANFATYRTYSWIPVEVPRGMNPLMFRRVQASIDRSLAARGFHQANPGDFAISFTVGEQDRTEISDYGGYWGWGGWGGWGSCWRCGWGGWGGFGGWGGWPMLDVYTVTERSIVIDIYDTPTHRPVWHGVVTKVGYPDQVDYSKLDANVDLILSKFPPVTAAPVSPPVPQAAGDQSTVSGR